MTTEEKKALFPYPQPGARSVWVECEEKDGEEFWCACDTGKWKTRLKYMGSQICGKVWRRSVAVPEGFEVISVKDRVPSGSNSFEGGEWCGPLDGGWINDGRFIIIRPITAKVEPYDELKQRAETQYNNIKLLQEHLSQVTRERDELKAIVDDAQEQWEQAIEEVKQLQSQSTPAEWIKVTPETFPELRKPIWFGAYGVNAILEPRGIDNKDWLLNYAAWTHWQPATIPQPPAPELSEAEEAWLQYCEEKPELLNIWRSKTDFISGYNAAKGIKP
jgi:hypothetical protein